VTVALLAAWVLAGSAPHGRRAMTAASVAGAWIALPLAVVPAAAVLLRRNAQRIGKARREARLRQDEIALLADLVTLGLRSGLPVRNALAMAGARVGALEAEVEGVLTAVDRHGAAAGLAAGVGSAGDLFRVLGGAVASGAPLVASVAAFANERRQADHARRMESVRRLPVRLLVPLALLVLPGFVLLAVAPAVLDAITRLID